tara:strand:- start:561 stop:1037 length:477 start_codon:yes stop_codon:yes gene_type:complete
MDISRLSPLYEYWNSQQFDSDEKVRLSKINQDEIASNLYRYEPYKWEILYQTVLRNVIRGDVSSIKGLLVLLSTINQSEKDRCLKTFEQYLDNDVIEILRNTKYQDLHSNKNIIKTLKILLNIFINPYGLEIKKDKKHIYENTGMFFYNLRKKFHFNK